MNIGIIYYTCISISDITTNTGILRLFSSFCFEHISVDTLFILPDVITIKNNWYKKINRNTTIGDVHVTVN